MDVAPSRYITCVLPSAVLNPPLLAPRGTLDRAQTSGAQSLGQRKPSPAPRQPRRTEFSFGITQLSRNSRVLDPRTEWNYCIVFQIGNKNVTTVLDTPFSLQARNNSNHYFLRYTCNEIFTHVRIFLTSSIGDFNARTNDFLSL